MSKLSWNDTIRIGGRELRCEPAAWVGGVVECNCLPTPSRHWEILGASNHPMNSIEDVMAYDDPRPLLPPASELRSAAELLEALALLPGAEIGMLGNVIIPLEAGELHYAMKQMVYVPKLGTVATATNYDARGRDWQREGVLREYIQSVEVKHV